MSGTRSRCAGGGRGVRGAHPWIGAAVLWGLIGLLAGCGGGPEAVGGAGGAGGVDRGVVFVEPTPEVKEANRRASEAVSVRWLVRRVLVRMDQPLGRVWGLADESVLPEISRAVWNGNGLRVGVLDASVYGDFAQAVGGTVEVQDLQILSREHAEVLRRSPPLAAEFMADLTVPPGAVRQETFSGGRLQLLLQSAAVGNGSAEVTLIPQHYRSRASLLPRPAYEKRLDGRVFDELAVTLNLPRNQTLLVGLYQAWHETAEPVSPNSGEPAGARQGDRRGGGSADSAASEDSAADGVTPAVWDTPAAPLNLGRGLLTTGLKRQDLQILYLLRCLPVGGG